MKNHRNKMRQLVKLSYMINACLQTQVFPSILQSQLLSSIENAEKMMLRAATRKMHGSYARIFKTYTLQLTKTRDEIANFLGINSSNIPIVSSANSIARDLMALNDCYSEWSCSIANRTISVVTRPIQMDDVLLGRFEITLRIPRTNGHPFSYSVSGLDEQYASSDSSIPHPHIQSDKLCEGDASEAITKALKQGRLLDFFQIINSVLTTYNSESAYRKLNEWSEVSCSDCGDSVEREDITDCQKCECLVCGGCQVECRKCDEINCGDCILTCNDCNESLCADCKKHCAQCDQDYCTDCFPNQFKCTCCEEHDETKEPDPENTNASIYSERMGQAAVSA